MKVSELIEVLQKMDPDLEVWGNHPEVFMQWGPFDGVDEAITDRFQRICLIGWSYDT